jgi:hypothetical protein
MEPAARQTVHSLSRLSQVQDRPFPTLLQDTTQRVAQLSITQTRAPSGKRKLELEQTPVKEPRSSQINRSRALCWVHDVKDKEALHNLDDEEFSAEVQKNIIIFLRDDTGYHLEEICLNDLRGTTLIPECEEVIFKNQRKRLTDRFVEQLLKLIFYGKTPSYPYGGAKAVAEFLSSLSHEKIENSFLPYDPGEPSRAFYEAFDRFDLYSRLDILKELSGANVNKKMVRSLLSHYIRTALKVNQRDFVKELFRTYMRTYPVDCISVLRNKELSEEFGHFAFLLYAEQSYTYETPLMLRLFVNILSDLPAHPDRDTALIRLHTPLPDEMNDYCVLELINVVLSIGGLDLNPAPISEPYTALLNSLFSRFSKKLILIHELFDIFEKLIYAENFIAVWPTIQSVLCNCSPTFSKYLLKLFLRVAYLHPQAKLTLQCILFMQSWAATTPITYPLNEENFQLFTLFAHYLPAAIPQGSYAFNLPNGCYTLTWKCCIILERCLPTFPYLNDLRRHVVAHTRKVEGTTQIAEHLEVLSHFDNCLADYDAEGNLAFQVRAAFHNSDVEVLLLLEALARSLIHPSEELKEILVAIIEKRTFSRFPPEVRMRFTNALVRLGILTRP